jgi:hypothetical protein
MDMPHEGPVLPVEAEVRGSPWVRAPGNSLLAYMKDEDDESGFAAEADACSSFVLHCAAQSIVLFRFKSCQYARHGDRPVLCSVSCCAWYRRAWSRCTSMACLPRNVRSAAS